MSPIICVLHVVKFITRVISGYSNETSILSSTDWRIGFPAENDESNHLAAPHDTTAATNKCAESPAKQILKVGCFDPQSAVLLFLRGEIPHHNPLVPAVFLLRSPSAQQKPLVSHWALAPAPVQEDGADQDLSAVAWSRSSLLETTSKPPVTSFGSYINSNMLYVTICM